MNNDKKKKIKLSISIYLALLIAFIIIISTIILMVISMGNIKNLVGEYESDINKLRNYTAAIMAQTVKQDIKKRNFDSTRDMLEFYKSENILTYVYITNDNTNKVILGNTDYDKYKNHNNPNIKELSKSIKNYTLYYGIEVQDKSQNYHDSFLDLIKSALIIIIVIGIITSIIFASIISKPLVELSKAAKQITDGKFDIKIKQSNFAEIDDLIYSCDEMAFQLNELYSSLELKVQERTIALEQANYKLQETQAMMVHSEKMRSLGELVAGIAHEINNPINFIHGNIMILQNYTDDVMKLISMYDEANDSIPDNIKEQIEKYKKDIDLDFIKEDVKDLIKSCIEGTQRTKNIILDLKNFSRMEERVLTQFDIPKEIDTTLNILNNKYKNRIMVIKNYPENLPKIEAYGGQLNQVFMNILDNAQDAIKGQGTLTINTYQEDENVKIEFIDSGAGIPKENLNKIFDPFFTTKTVGKGTGLGMSISYRVINDHNGKIEVESEVGQGTKFTITLPINHEEKKLIDEETTKDLQKDDEAN